MKKKTIVRLIVLLLALGGVIIAFYIHSQKNQQEIPKVEEFSLDVKEEITLDYGSKIPEVRDFCTYEEIEDVKLEVYFDDKLYEEDVLEELGEYKVKLILDDKTYDSKINVIDRETPLLELKELEIKENEKYEINSFILKCEDNAKKDCILNYEKDEMNTYNKIGTYDISVIAKDESGNEIKKETRLVITANVNDNKNSASNNTNSTNTQTDTNVLEVVTYKYGVKIITKGNMVTYDRTSFNAKTNDLKEEAQQQKSKELNNINQILTETNKYREEKGVSPLVLDDTLTTAANVRALEMAWGDKLSHTRPDGRSCFTIFDDIGFMSYYSGENIAWGQKNGTAASTWWRNSSGHYANIINGGYSKIGIGVYKFNGQYYYVQLFSS